MPINDNKLELIVDYTRGYCFELALYLHKLDPKRFVIYGLKKNRSRKHIDHYFVIDKKRAIIVDAYGSRDDSSLSSLLEPWGGEFNGADAIITGPYRTEKSFWRSFKFQIENETNKPESSLRREAFDTGWENKAKEAAGALNLLEQLTP